MLKLQPQIIAGSQAGTYHIDLKNGAGSVGAGEPSGQAADVTFTLKDTDFVSMFEGKLKPTNAFMTGKLKLAGDMGKAMALEKMMKKMNNRGYHTLSGKSKLQEDGCMEHDIDQSTHFFPFLSVVRFFASDLCYAYLVCTLS